MTLKIVISEDFSRYPAGRYHPLDGDATGERFRSEFLIPAFDQSPDGIIDVYLDGVIGLPSSFLEEAFGGLVRLGYPRADLHRRLNFIVSDSSKAHYIDEIWEYVDSADVKVAS